MSFLDLKLALVDKSNDTLHLLYYITYRDSIIVSEFLPEEIISQGVVFDVKSDSIIGYVSGEGLLKVNGTESRYKNPLQPDVIDFLTKNQENLNTWLYQEAKRRKIIN